MWNTETRNPIGDEGLSNGFGCDVGNGNCFRPPNNHLKEVMGRRGRCGHGKIGQLGFQSLRGVRRCVGGLYSVDTADRRGSIVVHRD